MFKDIYMLTDEKVEGHYKQAGHIYTVQEENADELIKQKKASSPYDYGLTHWRDKADKLKEDFQKELDAIKTNNRLTDIAKKEDIKALIEKYDADFAITQRLYMEDIESRLADAKTEEGVSALKTVNRFDANKVRQEAGVIVSDLVMASNLNEVVSYMEEKLQSIDREVAREVLSQFVSIKGTLDDLKGNTAMERAQGTTKIRGIYEGLKSAAADEAQVQANSKVGMYSAIKDHRSDLLWQWRQKKLAIESAQKRSI
ncbi:hypothetical protein QUF99_11155 [Bacillus sp. DX4.1]|uniref:hypothetical protein n=1 Tax=Bacillus sp. DX4.1 TaxID=3055867 RepID=UPI0025A1E96B|nr:hypothetical protein [Bacillus sp. DX4.1]MDM5187867.1 hypothetical protein [Bacillus sp. DX4.1]